MRRRRSLWIGRRAARSLAIGLAVCGGALLGGLFAPLASVEATRTAAGLLAACEARYADVLAASERGRIRLYAE